MLISSRSSRFWPIEFKNLRDASIERAMSKLFDPHTGVSGNQKLHTLNP